MVKALQGTKVLQDDTMYGVRTTGIKVLRRVKVLHDMKVLQGIGGRVVD